MILLKKYTLIIFLSLFIIEYAISQDFSNKGNLEVRFLKDQVEIEEGKSFFNILFIQNKSDKAISFNVQLNAPKGWDVIGNSFQKYTLQANAEISIPVRVSISKEANGGVGYAVVAIVNDEEGSLFNTAYSFVKIPVISSVKIKTDKNSGYFNQKALESKFEIHLENTGNIDEIVNIQFIADKSLLIYKDNKKITIDNLNIKSGETKILRYTANLNNEVDFRKYNIHKLNIKINLNDSLIQKRIWFKYINWKFKNEAPEYKTPLNIEIKAFNIFGDSDPKYTGKIYGNILLKNKRDIFYSFHSYNQIEGAGLWINSKFKAQYNSPKTTLFIGDYTGNFERSMYGRGIYISQKIGDKNTIRGAYTKRIVRGDENYALLFTKSIDKATFEIGSVYTKYPEFDNNFKLGYTKLATNILNNNLSFLYGYSQSVYNNIIGINSYNGWGYRANLQGNIKKISYSVLSEYGNPHYIGYSRGRRHTNGSINIPLKKENKLKIQYYEQIFRPTYIRDNEFVTNKYLTSQILRTYLYFSAPNDISLYISPVIDKVSTNNFYIDPNNAFSSIISSLEAGTSVYNKYSDNSFSFSARYGLTSIYEYSNTINGVSYEGRLGKRQYTVAQIRSGFKQKNFGVFFIYYLGPYNISQQFAYLYSLLYSKSLIIIPFYEKYLLDKKLKLVLRGSYLSNLETKNSRVNLNTGITWFAGKGWNINLVNTTSFNRVNNNSGSNSFTSSYFEFGINKSFNIQQPRLKYYNYTAIFYKDLNGNRIHDANEPGVPDVLAEINRANPQKDIKDKNYNGEFLANELFSNEKGEIKYENIVEGDYNLRYTPQDIHTDKFESEGTVKPFTSKKDTIMYIPFMERNKLFGKVTLHRTKHSALGDIPINNIKITVEGNNKTYSSLTDKEGNFELYIPVSDYYKVKIHNIFHEHFEIRQEYFIVKFNGYKQFEISFDFDEKERKIAFDESDFLITDEDLENGEFSFEDIKVIKQTNLKGIIKDENSLIPLHATVSILNNNTGQLISETASSKRTGVYFTSFFAGDNYNIKVSSKGYWVYKADLNIQQVTTFENINHDVLLKKIFIDNEIKTENLKFKSENAGLTPLAMAELDNIIATLFLNPSVHVEVSGHTDNVEAMLVDQVALSKSRAAAVAGYLESHGLKKSRIKIKAMGSSSPKSKDDSAEGRKENRRVEIRVAAF